MKSGDNLDNEKIIEKLASVETKVTLQGKEFHTRISKLEENNELLHRLTNMSENQQKMNERQQVQIDKMSETFSNININLTKLNMSQEDLKEDVKSIVNRVDHIEDDLKNETEKGKISLTDILIKYVTWWLLLPTGIIGTWLLIKLGLK